MYIMHCRSVGAPQIVFYDYDIIVCAMTAVGPPIVSWHIVHLQFALYRDV